jgi:hypothetical protein
MPTTMPTTNKKPPAIKKPVEGYEGYNLHETERSFGKSSGSISVNKPVGVDNFEAFNGYSQNYSQF